MRVGPGSGRIDRSTTSIIKMPVPFQRSISLNDVNDSVAGREYVDEVIPTASDCLCRFPLFRTTRISTMFSPFKSPVWLDAIDDVGASRKDVCIFVPSCADSSF